VHTDFVLKQDLELIQKPFESKVLLSRVRELLENR